MITPPIFEFSLQPHILLFNNKQGANLEIPCGYVDIQAKSIYSDDIDEAGIERLILQIEDIIESNKQLRLIKDSVITHDQLLMQVSAIFFNAKQNISITEMEHGFNNFIDHLSHYNYVITRDKINIVTYFVFVRELMHHLQIQNIGFMQK
ncbi:hypothetical protein GCM10023206_28400 [Acinetobacter puyangensis]|uniref:Uncharacterized protein n=1 Tax=Acinetobacter puyangensis TaxID=1096779 RepID=A0A240E482_9GAMM|nr:hypothetical protein [Acinetobacter puyangensis]SNX43392.1 hypothetical protein SAMN05421731_101428 [Acinetobacter puyangensis]